VAHLRSRTDYEFIHLNITEYIEIPGPVNYIWHFASPASPIDYLELPIQTLKVGALGTHNALGLAKAKGARLLLASTSEVYGDPLVHPQPESYWGNVNPIGPRGVYDEAKRFAEAITMAYHRYHQVETRIVRIFNTYGPRMRPKDGRVVPAFISEALKGEPITVFGDGSQTRSFCYVSDLIEGIYRLMMSEHADPCNIGNPREMSVLEFAAARRWCTSRCRWMTPRSASPTSSGPSRSWAGRRSWSWRRASGSPSTTLRASLPPDASKVECPAGCAITVP
jgi:dTDP-glucose 4,6-dehydratase